MEILIASFSSLLIQLYKRVKKCYGEKVVDEAIYIWIFIIALMWVGVTRERFISLETIRMLVEIVLMAVGVYEVLIKKTVRLLQSKMKLKID